MSLIFAVYPMLTTALNKTGRPIVFSCSWPAYQVELKMEVRMKICNNNAFLFKYNINAGKNSVLSNSNK